MVVAQSAVSVTHRTGSQVPIRTCIGCRQRVVASDLLRVVVALDPLDQHASASWSVVPDPRRRMPGRGAWLHPEPGCVELAQRRRAFARALRVSGTADPAPVHEYVAHGSDSVVISSVEGTPGDNRPGERTAGDDEQ